MIEAPEYEVPTSILEDMTHVEIKHHSPKVVKIDFSLDLIDSKDEALTENVPMTEDEEDKILHEDQTIAEQILVEEKVIDFCE